MRKRKLLDICLSLFDGAAAGTGTAGAGATGDTTGSPADAAQGKTGDLSKVIYGKQPATTDGGGEPGTQGSDAGSQAQAAEAAETPAERRKAFEELRSSERFKDLFTQHDQELINRRYAKAKTAETENATLKKIAEALNVKYGIRDDKDFSKLAAAVERDDSLWEEAAQSQGLNPQQFRYMEGLKRQNAALLAAQENDVRAMQARQKAEKWHGEATALRQTYPQFDLMAELQDQGFVAAINAGVPMKMAYEGKYHDQLLNQAAQGAAQTAEKRVVDNVRARGKRPAENGASSQGAAFTVKSDPSKLTLADYEEIAKRVSRGERIEF